MILAKTGNRNPKNACSCYEYRHSSNNMKTWKHSNRNCNSDSNGNNQNNATHNTVSKIRMNK